jgi:hypothetical protein
MELSVYEIREIAYQAAGVASASFMRRHPDQEMLVEEVAEGVENVLRDLCPAAARPGGEGRMTDREQLGREVDESRRTKVFQGDEDLTVDRDTLTRIAGFLWAEWQRGPTTAAQMMGALENAIVACIGIEGQSSEEATRPAPKPDDFIPDIFPENWR